MSRRGLRVEIGDEDRRHACDEIRQVGGWRLPLGCGHAAVHLIHVLEVTLKDAVAGMMLCEAGFTNVEVEQLPHDFVNSYHIARKG